MGAPIELAPPPRPAAARGRAALAAPRARGGRRRGVFVQVYLIGAYVFGAGQGALDAHDRPGSPCTGSRSRSCWPRCSPGSRAPRTALSLALAVMGTVQVALATGTAGSAGLHPLLALVVLTLAVTLVRRGYRSRHVAAG